VTKPPGGSKSSSQARTTHRRRQAFVFAGGVVGRVKRAGEFTSVVEFITSPSFGGAYLGQDTHPVIFQASRPRRSFPQGRSVWSDDQPQITPGMPLQLLSSKLSGVFPAGLTLGEVERWNPQRRRFQIRRRKTGFATTQPGGSRRAGAR